MPNSSLPFLMQVGKVSARERGGVGTGAASKAPQVSYNLTGNISGIYPEWSRPLDLDQR